MSHPYAHSATTLCHFVQYFHRHDFSNHFKFERIAKEGRAMNLWPKDWDRHGDELQKLLKEFQSSPVETSNDSTSPSLSAAGYVNQIRENLATAPVTLDEHVEEIEIDGVPCRVMIPNTKSQGVYLHFHGGGMVTGSASIADVENRHLSNAFDLSVVSVDYRLAPEFPFPAGPDDCFAVATWLLENSVAKFGTENLLIGGESAGAYLAALTLLRVKESGGAAAVNRFLGANLVFGVFDWSQSPSQLGKRPITDDFDVLSPEIIELMVELYLPGMGLEDRRDPSVSPTYADLRELVPAYFCVGSSDHLLDDTLFLANRWRVAGNSCEIDIFPRAPHAFTWFPSPYIELFMERRDAWFSEILA